MFDRRKNLTALARLRNALWPRSGWRRAGRYLAHRVRRISGTPYAIAAGFACGAAVSMTPLPGLHFLLAGLIAWAMGGSIIASAVGTVIGNPWTFPFIWLWIFNLGNWIIGSGTDVARGPITMSYLIDSPLEVFLPMIVGGIPTAIVTWFVFYWSVKRMVASYQAHRRRRLQSRAPAAGVGSAE
jgi:hypothetical protein